MDNNNFPWLLFCNSVKVRDTSSIPKPLKANYKDLLRQKITEQVFKRAKRVDVPSEREYMEKMLMNKKIVGGLQQDSVNSFCSNCLTKTNM